MEGDSQKSEESEELEKVECEECGMPKKLENRLGGLDEPNETKEKGRDDLSDREVTVDKDDDEDENEGRHAQGLRRPMTVSSTARKEHNKTHIPYRSWCKFCVRARSRNKAHKKGKIDKDDEPKVPRISMDYFFMSMEDEMASENPCIIMVNEETDEKFARAVGQKGVGVDTNKGYINVDSNMQTNIPGIYAIGDVTGKMLLAHVASAQGVFVVESIAGFEPTGLDYDVMPRAIYCHPQVASFGLTENQAREKGYELNIGRFPLSASGKAIAMGETEGMVKVVAEKEIGDILGVHMIGTEVTELLGEIGMARMLESTTEELGGLTHPHPTISEAIKEAALDAQNGAVHV